MLLQRPHMFVLIAVAGAMLMPAFSDRLPSQLSAADKGKMAMTSSSSMRPARFLANGQLLRPTGYRRWIYVGTPLTPNDMNNGKAAFPEFHSVYIHPAAFDVYRTTGEFPDGTMLVKELVNVGTKDATSGHGYFMGEFSGLEVLLKDRSRFKDQPGNWGFFSFGHEYPLKKTATIQPTANCSQCHGDAADEDFVFTQYYPVLRATRKQL